MSLSFLDKSGTGLRFNLNGVAVLANTRVVKAIFGSSAIIMINAHSSLTLDA